MEIVRQGQGHLYRSIRKEMGFTTQTLADHLGVTRATISERENDKTRITNEAWMALRLMTCITIAEAEMAAKTQVNEQFSAKQLKRRA